MNAPRYTSPTDAIDVALRFNGSVYRGRITGLRKRGEDVLVRVAFITSDGIRARVGERRLTSNVGTAELPADYFGRRYREGHGPTLYSNEARTLKPFLLADVDGVLDILERK